MSELQRIVSGPYEGQFFRPVDDWRYPGVVVTRLRGWITVFVIARGQEVVRDVRTRDLPQ